ncbi:hypothetical protein SEA_SALLYK_104 [Microbacterium phage SallyK]|nr:hypothetical protein SEA_SALLYK_104 [Microbacterium phage SallyK]
MPYPHAIEPIPFGEHKGLGYCTQCHLIEPMSVRSECTEHPDYPHVIVPPIIDIRPGDVIERAAQPGELITVHWVHAYRQGDLSYRYRYTCNPRGIDWNGHLSLDAQADIRIVSRGVAAVDVNGRSLLP